MKPIYPTPDKAGLTTSLTGLDAKGQPVTIPVVTERPLTIFLNRQEVVTTMTLGDQPEALAVGFLRNQNMLTADDEITAIDVDDELAVVVMRTRILQIMKISYKENSHKRLCTRHIIWRYHGSI